MKRTWPHHLLARLSARRLLVGLLALLLASAVSCTQNTGFTGTVRVLTHEDFHLPTERIATFEQDSGLRVIVQRVRDRAEVLNLLSRSDANPVADVVIGVDTFDFTRVIDETLVEPYVSLHAETIDPALRIANDLMTPVSYLNACLNFAPSRYAQPSAALNQLPAESTQPAPPPSGLADLLDPTHAGLTVLPDASSSRMGLYLLAALERLYPEQAGEQAGGQVRDQDRNQDPWPQILGQILRSGVELTATWEEAYFERFLLSTTSQFGDSTSTEPAPGTRTATWGSAGMPAVYAKYQPNLSHQPLEELVIDVGVAPNDCVRIVNYAGVVAGTSNRRAAGLFMDFAISPEFQFDIADRFGSRPARLDILSTPEWRRFGVAVDAPLLDAAYVGENWEVWRLTWSQIVRQAGTDTEVVPPVVTVTLPNN